MNLGPQLESLKTGPESKGIKKGKVEESMIIICCREWGPGVRWGKARAFMLQSFFFVVFWEKKKKNKDRGASQVANDQQGRGSV